MIVPTPAPRSAYVHIPFCAHKCGYCDFASVAGMDTLADRYLDALGRELGMRLGTARPVDTLFVGGGTPTRLHAGLLERLMGMLRAWFPLEPGGEWTVEANPGTLDRTKVDILAGAGVNRVSLGAQSFQPGVLRVLERNHEPDEVTRAVELVAPRFPHWSFDLIFGAPGSTLSMWDDDLDHALALGPTHLSCYGLVYEKGTPLWKSWNEGRVRALDESTERAMFELTVDRLESAGLLQYEISNYARPGHECRHNLGYWANESYYGIGLGAARYVDGTRACNTRDLLTYMRRLEAGDDPTGPSEQLDDEARARETAVLMLRRTRQGIDRAEFLARTGYELESLCGAAIERHEKLGRLHCGAAGVRLTREGLFVADTVMADLV